MKLVLNQMSALLMNATIIIDSQLELELID